MALPESQVKLAWDAFVVHMPANRIQVRSASRPEKARRVLHEGFATASTATEGRMLNEGMLCLLHQEFAGEVRCR